MVLEGDLFQMQCSNQILQSIAQKGMEVAAGLIVKIRECVKYIWSSQSRKEKFESALIQVKLAGQMVNLDVGMTWVSTYYMLKRATELRQGFVRLAKLDSGFKCLPNSDEWEQGIMICKCLEVLYDITDRFAHEHHLTTTMYFTSICEVNMNIRTWESSTRKIIREMAVVMRGDFDKYWSTCSLLMSVAVVLDPRYKAEMVNFVFNKLYGEHLSKTYISNFRQALNNIFSSYESQSVSSSPGCFGNSRVSSLYLEFAEFMKQNSTDQKTELENYLEEPCIKFQEGAFEPKFDVLSWWKSRAFNYPTLAKMARDILAVPVSTVSPHSAFSGDNRVLTGPRAYLVPEVIQELTCLRSWLP